MAKKFLSFFLALVTALNLTFPALAAGIDKAASSPTEKLTAAPASVEYPEAKNSGESHAVPRETFVYINPLYRDVITEDFLDKPSPIATIASVYSASSVSGAANYLRDRMERRVADVSLTIPSEQYYSSVWQDVLLLAYSDHTGVPTEGDYIAYQFAGFWVSTLDCGNRVQMNYTITYYDTLAQEQRVDAVLPGIIAGLKLSGKSDYEKIKAIYGWICANVTYDYTNLYNDGYVLKYTAYAALINRTAVCQGYAVLFYRMALEAGVDARVVAGYGGGDRHAWNIARMTDGYYYYLDSTWDAGYSRYSYFLKCQANFNDHVNWDGPYGGVPDYTSSAWSRQYPIGPKDYNPSVAPLAAPKITSVSSTAAGIKVTWGKVAGAAKYRVFYKPSGGSWTKAGDTADTSYTWTGAKNGTTYQIRVWCVSADGKSKTSDYDTIKTITYRKPTSQLAAPKLTGVSNVSTGIKVTWGKVTGAAKYRVFYKPSGGSWTKAGDTTDTSYTWKGAKSGTTYQIRVWCVSADGKTKTSDYGTIKSIRFVAAPNYTVSKSGTGIKLSWSKVTGAAKYRVYYKTTGSWKTLTTTTATSYTIKSPKNGATYTFRVRCVNSDGSVVSGYITDKTLTYRKTTSTQLAAPKLTSVSSTATGIKVTWSKVSGAAKYRVFYKPSGGSWAKAGDTTGTSYTWKGAKSGTTYQIRVWCISADGKTKTSDYDTIKTIRYIAAS